MVLGAAVFASVSELAAKGVATPPYAVNAVYGDFVDGQPLADLVWGEGINAIWQDGYYPPKIIIVNGSVRFDSVSGIRFLGVIFEIGDFLIPYYECEVSNDCRIVDVANPYSEG